ncbi:tRNA (uracil-5-)-methyltransferase like protein A [Cucumispora dikerogammari]|nr:tRNA (uracil-5-)-methyltransferase like protein A [Cucumispora dikerogammari]
MLSENELINEKTVSNKSYFYTLKPLPKHMNHKTLQKLLEKNLNFKKTDYKLKFRPTSFTAHIETTLLVQESFFMYRKHKICIIKENRNSNTEPIKTISQTDVCQTTKPKDIRDIVTPLWKLPYNETVALKTKELKTAFKNKDIDITFVPSNNFYRNKFEFAFGFSDEKINRKQILGFRGTSFSNAKNLVFCPLNVVFVPKNVKVVINEINSLLKIEKYQNLIFDRENKTGILKSLLVKSTEEETINLIYLQDTSNELLNSFMKSTAGRQEGCNLTELKDIYEIKRNTIILPPQGSIIKNDNLNEQTFLTVMCFLIKLSDSVENLYFSFDSSYNEGMPSSKTYKISGKSTLFQNLLGFCFEISFFSFFQTNIGCFENMITDIKKEIDSIKIKHTLLDLCCGSAVIGILLSDKFNKVVGIELNEQCLKGAKLNMSLNHVTNYEYHNMDIKCLHELDFTEDGADIPHVAILDPPRAGVPKSVIKTIRDRKNIKKLIFLCCDYIKSKSNLDDLCRPTSNEYRNSPFYFEKITGYDMFPFTKKMEVVFFLYRN